MTTRHVDHRGAPRPHAAGSTPRADQPVDEQEDDAAHEGHGDVGEHGAHDRRRRVAGLAPADLELGSLADLRRGLRRGAVAPTAAARRRSRIGRPPARSGWLIRRE